MHAKVWVRSLATMAEATPERIATGLSATGATFGRPIGAESGEHHDADTPGQ